MVSLTIERVDKDNVGSKVRLILQSDKPETLVETWNLLGNVGKNLIEYPNLVQTVDYVPDNKNSQITEQIENLKMYDEYGNTEIVNIYNSTIPERQKV